MHQPMHGEIHNYEVFALDYIAAGLFAEAVQLLEEGAKVCPTTPMTYYYMGWALNLDGKPCQEAFAKTAAHSPDFYFPNRLEAIWALQCALAVNPADAKAPYYLGNLWYDKR